MGYRVITSETFGASQRGGAVASHIRISDTALGPVIPKGKCDILVGFEPLEALRYAGEYLNPDGTAIVNLRQILPMNAIIGTTHYPDLDDILTLIKKTCKTVYTFNATDLAIKTGTALTMNMVMVGGLIGSNLIPIKRQDIINAIEASVKPRTLEMNIKAIDFGISAISND